MKTTIAIPARAGSTRFPNKPMAMLAGRTMLQRVIDVARAAAGGDAGVSVFVATDCRDIAAHAGEAGVPAIITPPSCPSGSDRVLSALRQMDDWPDFVVNLQGDAPLTPPQTVRALIDAFAANPRLGVVTPVRALSWEGLDALRNAKRSAPFSGTSAVVDPRGRALWFSKNILPAIRGEAELRAEGVDCPILQHMGLYGFRPDILEKFCALPPGTYERLEGLEQLRLLEHGISIQTVSVPPSLGPPCGGIDTPEDLARAEALLQD